MPQQQLIDYKDRLIEVIIRLQKENKPIEAHERELRDTLIEIYGRG